MELDPTTTDLEVGDANATFLCRHCVDPLFPKKEHRLIAVRFEREGEGEFGGVIGTVLDTPVENVEGDQILDDNIVFAYRVKPLSPVPTPELKVIAATKGHLLLFHRISDEMLD